jgi:putative ABC transport system permease protein
VKLGALDRKLLRDLRDMRGQAVAIVFVIAAGVASYVSMTSVYDSLEGSLDVYYRDYRFAEGFASVRRAPEQVVERLRSVPGIGTVETGIVAAVRLEVPQFDEPVTGLIVSLPEGRQPALNRVYLRKGRLVRPGREEEVILNEPFADAHGLVPGDVLEATLSGHRRSLRVVGIALSPTHLMQIQPGTLFPDPERFGVLWMGRRALAAAYDLEGAFNEVAFTLTAGASIDDVVSRVDRILGPFGGAGAYGRKDHPSHTLITEEFRGLKAMSAFLPVVFLAVAAFLLNIVITRLISLQREQVGILKAFGYRDGDVGLHYVKMVLVIALLGAAVGTALGVWAGMALGEMYLEYYRFPSLNYTLRPSVALAAVGLTTGAALVGVLRAVRRAVRLPPAEAMRPPPPPRYRATFVERVGFQRWLDQPMRMIVRSLGRQPVKAALSVFGIASSCALLIAGLFWGDVIDHIIFVQYGIAQREDLTVSFVEPTSMAALHELQGLPGVQYVEPFRAVPVRVRHEHRSYNTAIQGLPREAYLHRVIDTDLRPVSVPREGILLTERLAELLGARPGDELTVEVMEGRRRIRQVPLAGLAEQYIGVSAYMEMDALNRMVGEGQALSGALLLIDPDSEKALTQELQDRPRIAGIMSQDRAIQAYMDTAAQTMLVFMFVLSLFAGVIAFGVVYNSMRISLSERDRELASMRVLGFRRREVAFILLGEMALLVLLSIPVGFVLGAGLSAWTVAAFESEMFQFPVILRRHTFGLAAVIVLAAATLSSLLVRRRLDRLDLIGVLKTRE